jgi:HSP20 family molecular chaperone IbpA
LTLIRKESNRARVTREEVMERTIEEAIERAKRAYELVTGQPVPEISVEAPYARIPPEVDREEYVMKQAASLYERVRAITQGSGLSHTTANEKTQAQEARWVLPLPGVSKENITVELADGLLTVRVRTPGQTDRTQKIEVR